MVGPVCSVMLLLNHGGLKRWLWGTGAFENHGFVGIRCWPHHGLQKGCSEGMPRLLAFRAGGLSGAGLRREESICDGTVGSRTMRANNKMCSNPTRV